MIHEHKWEGYDPGNCCKFVRCPVCGLVKKTGWCAKHAAERWPDAARVYWYEHKEHWFRDGIPHNAVHAREYMNAIRNQRLPYYLELPHQRVLEVGCGPGHLVPYFLKHGMQYMGTDLSAWVVEYIQQAYDVPGVSGSWPEVVPALSDFAPHLVVALHSVEHIPRLGAGLAAMHDVLAPGGHLVIAVPDGSDYWNPDHLWFFRDDSLVMLLRETGFAEVRTWHEPRPNDREDNVWYYARKLS